MWDLMHDMMVYFHCLHLELYFSFKTISSRAPATADVARRTLHDSPFPYPEGMHDSSEPYLFSEGSVGHRPSIVLIDDTLRCR